jgi:hypothetical protein
MLDFQETTIASVRNVLWDSEWRESFDAIRASEATELIPKHREKEEL